MTEADGTPLITPAALEWIGRSVTYDPVSITDTDIRKFCFALGVSPESTVINGPPGRLTLVAPPSFYLAIRLGAPNLVDRSELAADGTNRWGPPIDAPRVMAGETSVQFVAPIVSGDTIIMRTTYEDVYGKRGSRGELAFVKMRHEFKARERTVALERYTRIFSR